MKSDTPLGKSRISVIVVLFGAAILAFQPLFWLVRSWYAPGYDGSGLVVFGGVLGLFAWSLSSGRVDSEKQPVRMGLALLVLSAAVRLIAQLSAINVVGALTLAVDVYALARICGLDRRRRPVAPSWLAVLFCFCLPVEAVLQRSVGFLLQQVSAAGACGLLTMLVDGVGCNGVRLLIAGKDVLVDVPCSGSRVLMIALIAFSALAALRLPHWRSAGVGLVTAITAAWFFNTLRITALALGIGFDLPVMSAPWHELIGLASIVGAVLVVVDWALKSQRCVRQRSLWDRSLWEWSPDHEPSSPPTVVQLGASLAFALAAIGIVSLEPRPMDVSGPVEPPILPHYVAGFVSQASVLSDVEQDYFTRFGGAAMRASYGPFGLLLVRTGSPLRHLHAPDVCLRGAGHDVAYLGADYRGVPSAVYRSQDPSGAVWRVQVSFVSSTGRVATSVSEAVWYWVVEPGASWTMVERISPWQMDQSGHLEWEAGVARAFNLT